MCAPRYRNAGARRNECRTVHAVACTSSELNAQFDSSCCLDGARLGVASQLYILNILAPKLECDRCASLLITYNI